MKKSYFDNIPGVVKLASRVAIYVPSTTDTNHPTDNRQQVEEVAAKLSAMFGGATATEARGYWVSQSAGLVGEAVTMGATVAEVDAAAQRITAEDTRGHLWDFYGTGYRAGAPLVLIMSDNGTPEEVTDDAIIIALEME